MTSRIYWHTHHKVFYGLGAGYTLSNFRLREALMDIGVELTQNAKVAMHLVHPNNFEPVPGKKNVLLTMYEMEPLPEEFAGAFMKADLVLAPSKFVAKLFKPHIKNKKMFVSKLGFDHEVFKFQKRSWEPGQDFYWTWIGAPNPRKGWPQTISAWGHLFQGEPWMKLIMKTSTDSGEGEVVQKGNVFYDSRSYEDPSDLAYLLKMSHGFVLPTAGEGFGLTPLEAMATGLPVVITRYGGHLDFLDESNAWLVDYVIEKQKDKYGVKIRPAAADIAQVGDRMIEIMRDYPAALRKAATGALRAHRKWTWLNAARQLMRNIDRMGWD